MNQLPQTKRVQIIAALVEGNSIRVTCRMTDVAKGTVLKLLVDLGKACARYQDEHLRNLPWRQVLRIMCGAWKKSFPLLDKGFSLCF